METFSWYLNWTLIIGVEIIRNKEHGTSRTTCAEGYEGYMLAGSMDSETKTFTSLNGELALI